MLRLCATIRASTAERFRSIRFMLANLGGRTAETLVNAPRAACFRGSYGVGRNHCWLKGAQLATASTLSSDARGHNVSQAGRFFLTIVMSAKIGLADDIPIWTLPLRCGTAIIVPWGDLVPLVPKALETLHVLLERRGSVVEKSELMKLVWPDTNVEDVGWRATSPCCGRRWKTNPTRTHTSKRSPAGIRFAAPVTIPEPPDVPPPSPLLELRQPSNRRRRWFILSVCVLAAGAFVYYQFYVPSRYLPKGNGSASLAVVPFECLCPGMDGDRFSQGFNEVVVADLSKLSGVQVISPSTVRRYQRARVSMALMDVCLAWKSSLRGPSRSWTKDSGLPHDWSTCTPAR